MTAFIKPPTGYSIEDIDEGTLKLDGAKVIRTEIVNNQFVVAKFKTRELSGINTGEKIIFTLSGKLKDRTPFVGRDTVKVIDVPEKKIKSQEIEKKVEKKQPVLLWTPVIEPIPKKK